MKGVIKKMDKKISEMTEQEILRQQLELLADASLAASPEELPRLTEAMIDVRDRLI